MPIWINDNGVRRELGELYINDNGVRREIGEAWINDNGVRRRVFVSFEPLTLQLFAEGGGGNGGGTTRGGNEDNFRGQRGGDGGIGTVRAYNIPAAGTSLTVTVAASGSRGTSSVRLGGTTIVSGTGGANGNFGTGGGQAADGTGTPRQGGIADPGGAGGGGAGAASIGSDFRGGGSANPTIFIPARPGQAGQVIIRYAGAPRATGGTITQGGGFTTHTFRANGTFTVTS